MNTVNIYELKRSSTKHYGDRPFKKMQVETFRLAAVSKAERVNGPLVLGRAKGGRIQGPDRAHSLGAASDRAPEAARAQVHGLSFSYLRGRSSALLPLTRAPRLALAVAVRLLRVIGD